LSALMFTYVLMDQGIPSVYVNLERLVDRHFEEGQVNQTFYDYITGRLQEVITGKVQEAEARLQANLDADGAPYVVPVVTGYLGPVPGSILNTIGRGYTDLTAALCAVGLQAEELQIWKEVDGIFTADPRKAPLARLLPYISPDEAAELTYYGSEVIHPFTMEQVIRASIPIRIKNTFNPPGRGTVVYPDGQPPDDLDELEHDEQLVSTFTQKPILIHRPSRRFATAVTIKDDVTVINVHSNRKSVSHGFFAHIFRTLDKYGIVVDLISTSEVHVSMALGPNVKDRNLELALSELRKLGTVPFLEVD
jgi:aspartate kinase